MKKRFQSISYKLLSTLLVATTLPMLIYCFFFSYDMRKTAEQTCIKNAADTLKVIAQNIEHSLSTSIDVANKGVYLNHQLRDLLFTRDSRTFLHAESANSLLLFSYMTNISVMTPEATQIQFSAYKSGKSLLLTTKNLQKYIRSSNFEQANTAPVPAFQAYIIPPHRQTSYDHQLSYMSNSIFEDENAEHLTDDLVFTICLPIYHLPVSNRPSGELLIDVSLDFFEKFCGFMYDEFEHFYIVNDEDDIIFAYDSTMIGTRTADPGILSLTAQAAKNPGEFISKKGDSELWLCQRLSGSSYNWYMLKSIPMHKIYQTSNIQLTRMLLTFGICLITALLISGSSILRYTNPLIKATRYLNLTKTQKLSRNSRLSDYVSYRTGDEIGILFQALEELIDTVNNFIIRQFELEIINRTTELKVLEAQINPHFIYNTLQCLATRSLEHHDREQYDYISSFGQLMQYSMNRQLTLVPLQEELNHIRRYIELQKMRFTSQLSVSFEISSKADQIVIPKMTLQPLIENSIKHGNLFNQEYSTILIRADLAEHQLHLYIADNGCPPPMDRLRYINQYLVKLREEYIHKLLTPDFLSSIDENSLIPSVQIPDRCRKETKDQLYAANNIGLTNVLLRLLLNFGQDCRMELNANDQEGTTVHLYISCDTLKQTDIKGENEVKNESTDNR